MSRNTSEEVKIKRQGHMPLRFAVIPYLIPWGLMVAALAVSGLTHWMMNGPVALSFLALFGAGLTYTTYVTWSLRHRHARLAATAFTGFITGWLTLATAVSPVASFMLYTWVLGGSFLALTWNIRYAALTPTNKHDQPVVSHVDPFKAVKGLKGLRVKGVKEGDGYATIRTQSDGQVTGDDVRARTKNIAGVFAVDPSAVKAADVRGRGDQVDITFRPDNPTSSVVLWPGLSASGKSVSAAPLRYGIRSDATDLGLWIVGDDKVSRSLPHTMWTGMNGSGKTEAFVNAMLELRSRTDAVPVVADPAKFMQSFGDVADAFPVAADGIEQTRQLVRNLIPTIQYRADLLGRYGYKQWEPECYTRHGIPLVWIHIEESHMVMGGNQDFVQAIAMARSVGLPLSASLQVAVFRNMPREARSQFANSLAFGVTEMQDAVFALTPGTLASGADPTQWGNNEPGRHYAELTGVASDKWPQECRAYKTTVEQKRSVLDATRPYWAQLDAGTALRLGEGINRPDSVIDARILEAPDPLDEPGPTSVILTKPAGTAGARRLLADRIDELEAGGTEVIKYADFADLLTRLNKSRAWVYTELGRQEREGRLERTEGREKSYRIMARMTNGSH